VTEQDPPHSAYAGLVTRTVAIAIDIVAINIIAVLTAGALSFIAGLFGHKNQISLAEAIGGLAAWAVWFFGYFVTFWNITGQTLGNHLLGIRVVDASSGGDVHIRQAIRRFFALLLAVLPLGAGLVRVLFDDRRRGFHDRVAHTVVFWVAPHKRAAAPPVASDPVIDAEAVVVVPEGLPRPAAEPAPTQQT
jgi:uncharacterized RDD family membrane protein YckC